MARRIISDFKNTRADIRLVDANTKGNASTLLRALKRKNIKPTVSLSAIQKIVDKESKKSGVPIYISKHLYLGKSKDTNPKKRTEGIAVLKDKGKDKGAVFVRIHPIVQYRSKEYTKSLIGHELDHARVFKGWKKYQVKKDSE